MSTFTKTLRNLGLTLLLGLSFAFFTPAKAVPTTLALGDIAFTGYNSDSPESYSFVLLVPVGSGTVITFTDNGWFAAGGFRATENTIMWMATSDLPCGTEVHVTGTTASTGMMMGTSPAFPSSGDQIFAYQGTTPTAGDQSSFLAALQMNGAWDADATSSNTSAQPSVFTDGVNSNSISPEVDNAVFDCSTVGPDAASIRSAVNNSANWTTSNSGVTMPAGCAFSCGSSSLDIVHPTSGTNMVSVPCGSTHNYYDSGGAGCDQGLNDGNSEYSINENGITVLCPDVPGMAINLEFLEVDTETSSSGCFDTFFIYDGDTTADPLLFTGCGEEGFASCPGGFPGDGDDCAGTEGSGCDIDGSNDATPVNNIFTSTDASGCITVQFFSDGSVQNGGWTAAVTCVPGGPGEGDLVITEIMQNPAAVSDTDGEWFEVYNPTGSPIDMLGMVIRDNGSNTHTIASSVVVPSGGYVVLGRNDDMSANGGVSVDYEYSNFFLGNSSDAVVIESAGGTIIDEVAYDNGATFPDPNGASMQLDPTMLNATANNSGSNWCESNTPFGDGDLGTPGAANTSCTTPECSITNVMVSMHGACDGADADFQVTFDVVGGSGQYEIFDVMNTSTVYGQFLGGGANGNFFINGTIPGPTMSGSVMVNVRDVNNVECTGMKVTLTIPDCPIANCVNPGDLIITEIMQNPSAVSDGSGEWFEVYNTTGAPIDMIGYVIKDDDFDSHIITSSVVVPAGGFAVFGNNADFATNGGVNVDYDYNGNWFLSNGSDEVIIECGVVEIDRVNYDNGATFPDPNGASMSLDPGSFNAMANDNGSNWCEASSVYGDGDRGTPSAANDECCAAPTAICANITVTLDGTGTATISGDDIDGGSIVECGLQSRTASPNTFNCSNLGSNTAILTVTDVNGDTDQCTATVTVIKGDALPPGWDHDDVGGATGDAGFDPCDDKFFVESNGITFPISDKIHFAWTYRYGDFDIIAEVTSITAGGLAGIMARESLAGGSKKVALRTQLSNFVHRDIRYTTDGYSITQQLFRPQHNWLRLKRIGNLFIGYTSMDGVNWKFAFFTNVDINSCLQVGLFAEGPIDNTISVACFENVSVTGSGCEGPALIDGGNNDWTTEEVRQGQDFRVFPNPASTEATIDLGQIEDGPFTLRVFNNLGQEVFRNEYLRKEDRFEYLDVSQYNNGLYLINIELSDGKLLTKKLTVNK